MPAPQPSRTKKLVRNVGPWVVAVVALVVVMRAVKWTDLLHSFETVPLPFYLGSSLALIILNCAADCFAMYFVFGWFGCRVAYRELFVVRAATYLLAVVQYFVGQAAIIGFLHNRKGVPGWRAAGFILFISGINLGVLMLISAGGLIAGESPVPWLRWVAIAVGAGALFYALILAAKPKVLVKWTFLAPLFEMGVWGHVKAVVVRTPHVAVLILWHFIGLRSFGVAVPVWAAIVYLPAVFFAAALPISVQGLGLAQASAVYFFARYAGGNQAPVIAYSLSMTAVSLVTQVSMGLMFLPAGRRLGMKPAAEEDQTPPPVSAEIP
jgi:hypothetical protein